jgi:two-component system sensor histidine kinase/response regulator
MLEVLRGIPDLSVDLGLARTTNKPEFYVSLLRKFVLAQEDAMQRLQQALDVADFATAERIAHTLRGVAGSLGAKVLPAQAEQLEMLLRKGQVGQELNSAIHDTVASLERLISGLKQTPGLLQPQPEANTSPLSAAQRLDAGAVLERIQSLLAQDDAEAAELWETHAVALRALLANATQIEGAIEGFDYERALQLLLENELTPATQGG